MAVNTPNYQKKREMTLYLHHKKIAAALGWADSELRTVRRVLECPVHPVRPRQFADKVGNHFQLEPLLDWLRAILPRLTPQIEHDLRAAAGPLESSTL